MLDIDQSPRPNKKHATIFINLLDFSNTAIGAHYVVYYRQMYLLNTSISKVGDKTRDLDTMRWPLSHKLTLDLEQHAVHGSTNHVTLITIQ